MSTTFKTIHRPCQHTALFSDGYIMEVFPTEIELVRHLGRMGYIMDKVSWIKTERCFNGDSESMAITWETN